MDNTFVTDPPAVLNTDTKEVFESSDVDDVLRDTYKNLAKSIEDFQHTGSGWLLDKLLKLDLHVLEYSPLQATSYIPLPEELLSKKAIINIKNKDEKCFLWSVIAGTYLKDTKLPHLERPKPYKEHEDKFNLEGITFPMSLTDIPKFERRNNVSVSVYSYQEKTKDREGFVYPLKVSKEKMDHHVDLLLIANDDTNHYCYIKDFNKLVGSQYSSDSHKMHFCRFCLHGFSRHYVSQNLMQHRHTDEEMKKKLEEHEKNCFAFSAQRTEFPEDPVIKFKNIRNQVQAPFVVYADFESILKALNDETKYQEHLACSYAYQIVSNIPGCEFSPRLYVGEDAVEHFLDSLQDDLNKHIMPIIEKDADMIWDDAAKEKFHSDTHCHICEKELNRDLETPARDHCHFTGRFRGATHQQCNREYKIEKEKYKLPILFHNLRGYDAHLIFQKVQRKHGKISVIPNNSERYISFTLGRLKFLDSMQFLSASLDNLSAQLNENQFINLQKLYPDQDQQVLLRKKGVYPYDYMDCMARFEETCLPGKERFYNKLNKKHISDEEYAHAENVWVTLNCNSIRDYHDHYLKSDVLLLADVFENFRKMALQTYKLDPVHYYSLPGLSWDTMLKYTEVELDLITDPDMYQMVENGMRGGISNISHRYAAANHPRMDTYNPNEELRTLTYQDANALYSWAMSQALPLKDFKWTNLQGIDILEVPKDNRIGYIVEVDLEYPKELHDAHNLYPLAPEHINVADEMLSPFQRDNFPAIRGSVKKLIPNLHDKTKYVLHYRNLQLYIQLGMKIKNIHRVIQFEQSLWMKSFIDLNTELRKEAVRNGDKVGKDLFKLMNNAVFGKTMENLRKRINFEVVTSRKIALKRIAKPNFQRVKKFREDLVGIHMTKPVLILNRPIQVGFTVLDLSKYHMFDFHYNTWMEKFPNSRLLFTDTDSLAYEVTGHDLYAGMAEINDEFDFSEYPDDHSLYSIDNMKVVGKFKDECKGLLMLNFVGLRPKLYSFDYERIAYFDLNKDGEEVEVKKATSTSVCRIVRSNKNTAKGVKESVAEKLSFNDYDQSLRTLEPTPVDIRRIGSDRHKLYSYDTTKIALSAYDNKRWICNDGIHTYAFGHYRTL